MTADAVAAQYGYDRQSATQLPAFALVPEFMNPDDFYARMLLLQQCMTGMANYTVTAPPPDTPTTVTDQRTRQRRLTPQIAAQWGYQVPEPPATVILEPGDEQAPGFAAKEQGCGKQTKEKLGDPPEPLLNSIVTSGFDAINASDQVKKVAAAWKTCMGPVGVVDLPANPHDMPSPSVAGTANVGAKAGVPSAREKEVALKDAECRESTGFTKTEFRVAADAQLRAIGKDTERFNAVRKQFTVYFAKINKVIEELG